MELFGTCFYLWQVFFAVYVVGMFAVGYPMGKYSIMLWKDHYNNDWEKVLLKYILFPVNSLKSKVGIEERRNPYLPMTMRTRGIGKALIIENKTALAEYQIIQMFVWPIRLAYLLAVHCCFIFFGIIALIWTLLEWLFIKQPAKLLLKTEGVKN